ncbi:MULTISPECIES: alpha/beta hydrolase [Rheinheimera]|uniref:Alpha/beta hydrolase n=1 Tax=Rheinheimera marina TaxID=1774958 RepID=A0ABV9JJ82_9GAMM
MKYSWLWLMLCSSALTAQVDRAELFRLDSQTLQYPLQYWLYRPAVPTGQQVQHILYVSDGAAYLQQGKMIAVLEQLIQQQQIRPLYVVFVDSRDPDQLTQDRRNQQYLCNTQYAAFYRDELIPKVESQLGIQPSRGQRGIMGLSFGATNALCFGLMLPEQFGLYGLQSPANSEHLTLLRQEYKKRQGPQMRLFYSVGNRNDNLHANTQMMKLLEKQGHQLVRLKVEQGHDWDNWQPLLDDLLVALFPAEPSAGSH